MCIVLVVFIKLKSNIGRLLWGETQTIKESYCANKILDLSQLFQLPDPFYYSTPWLFHPSYIIYQNLQLRYYTISIYLYKTTIGIPNNIIGTYLEVIFHNENYYDSPRIYKLLETITVVIKYSYHRWIVFLVSKISMYAQLLFLIAYIILRGVN